MNKRIVLTSVVAGMAYLVFSSHSAGPARAGYDCTGAEAGGTGSYANSTGCTCHGSTATTGIIVSLELDSAGVATTHYKGGLTYNVKITGSYPGTTQPKYGFQLNAMVGTSIATVVHDAGTWATTGLPASTHVTPPGSYTYLTTAEHSSPLSLSGVTFTQTFSWTAPVAGTGDISFWGAANFVNGNGSESGDKWNTNHINISEWPVDNAVAATALNVGITPFPNPVTDILNLRISNAAPGSYAISAYGITGKCMTKEIAEINNASQIISLNAAEWPAGIYQVMIESGGHSTVAAVLKQ